MKLDSKIIWRLGGIVASLAIIAFIWAITINPIEFVRFERDNRRVQDVYTLTDYLRILERDYPQALKGDYKKVYLSLPDNDPNCSSWDLPELADGYSYSCVSFMEYKKIDGSGWLPADFAFAKDADISSLPVDPLNGEIIENPITEKKKLLFYQYIRGSSVVTASFEGLKMLALLTQQSSFDLIKKIIFEEKTPDAIALVDGSILALIDGSPKTYTDSLLEKRRKKLTGQILEIIEYTVTNLTGHLSEEEENEARVLLERYVLSFLFEDGALSGGEESRMKNLALLPGFERAVEPERQVSAPQVSQNKTEEREGENGRENGREETSVMLVKERQEQQEQQEQEEQEERERVFPTRFRRATEEERKNPQEACLEQNGVIRRIDKMMCCLKK